MRVTHIITRLVVGGAQENTLATLTGLKGKPGLELSLISGPTLGPEGSLESKARGLGVNFGLVPDLVRPVHPWKDVKACRELTNTLRKQQPHIVHTHSGKAGILGRLAASKAGVPIIIHHIHGPSFGPWQSWAANIVFRTAERIAGKVTHHFFCSASAMSRLYLSAGIGRPEQYTRVFSGFDMVPFLNAKTSTELKAKLGIGQGDFVIGKVSRLAPLKGHADLIAAAPDILKQCPNARFLILGDGRLRNELQRQIQRANLTDRFIFTGLVPPNEIPEHIALMDCVVHLSYREALSRVLPQALAVGKPVVAYDFDGAEEVCLDGKTGFLVPRGKLNVLVEKVAALASNSAMRNEMGRKGQTLVRESFTVDQMVATQYEQYLKLAQSKGIV